MNTQQVADRLVSLCREGKILAAVQELYSSGIVSKEMNAVPCGDVVSKGIKSVTKNNNDWFANIEKFHKINVSEPIVAGNHFAIKIVFDATRKVGGEYYFEELCIYEVNDGKIVYEQFFYSV